VRKRRDFRSDPLFSVCIGEADKNCVVDFRDVSTVLALRGPLSRQNAVGDTNADQDADFNDSTTILYGWGARCE
jgi:hypothetical protein